MPVAPLADADSQAAAVAALDALTRLDADDAEHWQRAASSLRARIQRRFTAEVIALDANDVPVTGTGS